MLYKSLKLPFDGILLDNQHEGIFFNKYGSYLYLRVISIICGVCNIVKTNHSGFIASYNIRVKSFISLPFLFPFLLLPFIILISFGYQLQLLLEISPFFISSSWFIPIRVNTRLHVVLHLFLLYSSRTSCCNPKFCFLCPFLTIIFCRSLSWAIIHLFCDLNL